jgi:hypothetical protein
MELIGLKHWKTFQANYLKPLLQQGLLAMTIPEKPKANICHKHLMKRLCGNLLYEVREHF